MPGRHVRHRPDLQRHGAMHIRSDRADGADEVRAVAESELPARKTVALLLEMARGLLVGGNVRV